MRRSRRRRRRRSTGSRARRRGRPRRCRRSWCASCARPRRPSGRGSTPYSPMPALGTIESSRPNVAHGRVDQSGVVGGRLHVHAARPRRWRSRGASTSSSSRSCRRPPTTTLAPASTSCAAAAAPMPAVAPVMATTVPDRSRSGIGHAPNLRRLRVRPTRSAALLAAMTASPIARLRRPRSATGSRGRVFHAPLIDAAPGTVPGRHRDERSPSGRRRRRAAYPGVAVYETPEQAWAGGHDLAVISTAERHPRALRHRGAATPASTSCSTSPSPRPPRTPRELAELAARRGPAAHPVPEPPVGQRLPDRRRREATGRHRHGAPVRVAHRAHARGARRPGGAAPTDPADMGGMLYDLGAHVVDQALQLMGPVVDGDRVGRGGPRGRSDATTT